MWSCFRYLVFYIEKCDRVEWISMRPNYMINGAWLCLNKNGSSFLILLNKYWCSGMPQIGYTQRYGRLEGAARARAARHYFQRGCARAEIWVTPTESANTTPASRICPPRISFYVQLTSEPVFNTNPAELSRTSQKTIKKSTQRSHRRVANPEAWILHTSQVHCTESDTGGQVVGWCRVRSIQAWVRGLTSRAGSSHGGATRTARARPHGISARPPDYFRCQKSRIPIRHRNRDRLAVTLPRAIHAIVAGGLW